MDLTAELKRKRGEILDRLIEIRETQAGLEAQMGALDQVIVIYEPDYEPSGTIAGHKTRKRREKAPEMIEIDTLEFKSGGFCYLIPESSRRVVRTLLHASGV